MEAPVSPRTGRPVYAPELWAKARQLYFQHYSLSQISRLVQIPEETLSKKVYGGKNTKTENTWLHQRKTREAELVETLVDDNVYHLQQLFRVSLPLLTDAISTRAKEHYGDPTKGVKAKPMSVKEAKDLTEIVTSLDRLFRLETKKPTQLFGFVPVSLDDLKKAVQGDVFLDISAEGKLQIPSGEKDVTPTADDIRQLPEEDDGSSDDDI